VFAWGATFGMARLTGAVALVILLAAGAVGAVGALGAGWWRLRNVRAMTMSTSCPVVTVGESVTVSLQVVDRSTSATPMTTPHPLHVALVDRGEVVASGWMHDGRVDLDVTFARRGVVDRLTVQVASGGSAGLCWWRRTVDAVGDELAVAPAAAGPGATVTVDPTSAAANNDVGAVRPAVAGEVDGVRPWREGDADHAVHWPTSLRTGTLTVFDHRDPTTRRHIVDASSEADDPDLEAGRVRWALDDLRRRGIPSWVRLDGGDPVRLLDPIATARWTAEHPPGEARPAARRRWSFRKAEPDETLTARARWLVALTSAIALVLLTSALGSGPINVISLVGGCLLAAAITSGGTTNRAIRAIAVSVVAALVGVGLVDVFGTMSRSDGLLSVLTGPLPNALMLLVVLHGFECTRRSAGRAALGFSAVVTAYAAGQRIDPNITWWLLAWGLSWIVAMRAVAAPPVPAVESSSSDVATVLRMGWRSPRRPGHVRRIAGTGLVVAGGVAATVAVLSVITVPSGPARIGLPSSLEEVRRVAAPDGIADALGRPTAGSADRDASSRTGSVGGYPGFDDTLDTAMRGDLGDDIVMRVRAPEPDFWRGQTFSDFDGRNWTVDRDPGSLLRGPDIELGPVFGDVIDPALAPTSTLVQTFYVEFDHPNVLFAAYRPERVIVEGDVFARNDGALRTNVVLTAGAVYTVISERTLVTPDVLARQGRIGDRLTPLGRQEFSAQLAVPASTTARTVALADQLAVGAANTYELIRAMEAWIGANVEYDLAAPVPAAGVDAVDDLLFGSRRGFCEQIATALTIMLRTQGVPARLATGYVAGTRNRVTGVWEVRARDAHAWVEVWFPDTGWQSFDPTADVPLAGDSSRPTVGGDLARAMGDAMREHGRTILGGAVAVAAAWLIVSRFRRLVVSRRYRRCRGRWGLLQDRFIASTEDLGVESNHTNPARARQWSVVDPSRQQTVTELAGLLDRAAFDPDFVDDEASFRRAATLVASLERAGSGRRSIDPDPSDDRLHPLLVRGRSAAVLVDDAELGADVLDPLDRTRT
jgi:protein-glutamine gamma-glutamyltransferase